MDKITLGELQRMKEVLEDCGKEDIDRCSEQYVQQLVSLSLVIMKKVKLSKHYDN